MPAPRQALSLASIDELIAQMRSCPFFEAFPDGLLEELATHARSVIHPPGYAILREGQLNHSLFFLMDGVLGVYNSGELVIRLDKIGDVVGEVSAINQRPCNAAVVAETVVELLELDAVTIFNETDSYGALRFQNELYKNYADILSQKLEATNERAKLFEITNERLEEAQRALMRANHDLEVKIENRTGDLRKRTEELNHRNAELTASYEKMTELYQTKDLTIKKLSALYSDHLQPLKSTLAKFKNATQVKPEWIKEAESEVVELVGLLEPLSSYHSEEMAMRDKKVLLAETDKKMQRVAKLALSGTGMSLQIVSDYQEGKEQIDAGNFDILCVNADLLDLTLYAQEKRPNMKVVLFTSEDIPTYLARLKTFPAIDNIVIRNPEDRSFTVKNLLTTVRKLLVAEKFGLEKYLFWGADVKSHKVTGSDTRRALIEKMAADLESMGVRSRVIDDVKAVAEELLMNAIYDAPTDAKGKPLFNHMKRNDRVELKPEQQATLRYACDGVLVGISVEDPFGAVKKESVLSHLEHCYAGTNTKLENQAGGGGEGLHILIETADLVIFNVDPNKRTEAIALFHVDSHAKKTLPAPSFQFFYKDSR